MLAAIFGDMVGRPFEGPSHEGFPLKSMDFPLFGEESQFSDDTVLTIAVADVLLNGGSFKDSLVAWGKRYPNAGYGGRFIRWLQEPSHKPYNGWSNGSAMRVSPIGWAREGSELLAEAKRSAEVSHNHPDGIQGAQAVAYAIYLARTGQSTYLIRNDIAHRFGYDLYRRVDMIRRLYKFDSSCCGSVPEAIICALEATSVEESIRLAVSLGGDTDTQACIAGAIAEARFGFPEEFRAEVMSRLPEEMQEIVIEFEQRFM